MSAIAATGVELVGAEGLAVMRLRGIGRGDWQAGWQSRRDDGYEIVFSEWLLVSCFSVEYCIGIYICVCITISYMKSTKYISMQAIKDYHKSHWQIVAYRTQFSWGGY